jgi:hypothetical protein
MNARFSAFDHICMLQWRQVLQPKTSLLHLSMTEVIGMINLIRLADAAADDADGVFERDVGNGRIKKLPNKTQCFCLFPLLVLEPPCATDSQMCAGRVGNYQVPLPRLPDISNIVLDVVRASILCRKQITRPSVMPQRTEGAANSAGKFAGNKNAQGHFNTRAFIAATF